MHRSHVKLLGPLAKCDTDRTFSNSATVSDWLTVGGGWSSLDTEKVGLVGGDVIDEVDLLFTAL